MFAIYNIYPQTPERATELNKPFVKSQVLRSMNRANSGESQIWYNAINCSLYILVHLLFVQLHVLLRGYVKYFGFLVYFGAALEGRVLVTQSFQTALSVTDINVQTAASAFLTPFSEVFAFLEDTMVCCF